MVKKNPINSKTDKLKEIEIKKTKRDVLTAGLHLPRDTKNLVFALRKLAYLQELKKTTQTRSHPLLQLVVKKEIARRLKIEVKYLDYLSEIEIGRLLKLNHITPKFKKELKQRGSSAVLIIRNMKSTWLIGEKAKDFIKNNGLTLNIKGIKEITGQAASKGLVRGHVKICLFSQEINKIKKGDILVTNMTTPDFVPGMRLAAAIITDEGGITSHAAIVARELNKPCIIGTKIASKVFHDGDLVEVDANKGTIKKLS
jgi:pyruvate,water dikinase